MAEFSKTAPKIKRSDQRLVVLGKPLKRGFRLVKKVTINQLYQDITNKKARKNQGKT
jgi:hypothetical protein